MWDLSELFGEGLGLGSLAMDRFLCVLRRMDRRGLEGGHLGGFGVGLGPEGRVSVEMPWR